jgi:hypothetical protein
MFLSQKLPIHGKRSAADQAKDIHYIHDTLQVFGTRLDELRDEWTGRIRLRLHWRASKEIETAHTRLFGETPDALRESCRYGLQQVMA